MTKVIIKAADGTGAVEAFHNANKKLETTATGAAVTGSNLSVTNSGGAASVTVVTPNNTDGGIYFNDGANAGAVSYLHTNNSMSFRVNTVDDALKLDSSGNVNIGGNTAANPLTYLRFGATEHGAADIRPTDDGSHKVGLAFYVDGSADSTINPTEKLRVQSDGDVKINDGNLVIGTAGHGIDFSAHGNATGMSHELLDDYEVGTFAAQVNDANITTSASTGFYVKIGDLVNVTITMSCTATSGSGAVSFPLPFAVGNNHTGGNKVYGGSATNMHSDVNFSAGYTTLAAHTWYGQTNVFMYQTGGSKTWSALVAGNLIASNTAWIIDFCYSVA